MQMLGLECHIVHNEYHSWDLVKLDDDVLNGAMVLILVTCVVSSLVTDRAARKMATRGTPADAQADAPRKPIEGLTVHAVSDISEIIDLV